MLTVEELRDSVPKQHKSRITQQFVDDLNKMIADPQMANVYTANILTYSKVLQEGRFKLDDYFNAVMFVSYKTMGMSNMAAYQKVFPARVQDMVNRNISNKDMAAYASTYNKTKLVTLIYEQTLIPDHIMYASIRYKSIARLADLMENAKCERDQVQAAATLLKELKAPESAKINVEIGTTDTGVIADLSAALANLSRQQVALVQSGEMTAKDIAHAAITSGKQDE